MRADWFLTGSRLVPGSEIARRAQSGNRSEPSEGVNPLRYAGFFRLVLWFLAVLTGSRNRCHDWFSGSPPLKGEPEPVAGVVPVGGGCVYRCCLFDTAATHSLPAPIADTKTGIEVNA